MIYRRRTSFRKKRPLRRRRNFRRKKMSRNVNGLKPFFFKLACSESSWTIAAAASNSAFNITFQLNTIPQITQYSQIYDEYKICAVRVTLQPAITTSYGGNACMHVFSVIDYDDSQALPDANTARAFATCRRHLSTQKITRYFRPRYPTSIDLTSPPGTTGTTGSRRGWVNTSTAGGNVTHYGVKYWCEQIGSIPTTSSISFAAESVFYVAFRMVR
jgi:hypothetical protein